MPLYATFGSRLREALCFLNPRERKIKRIPKIAIVALVSIVLAVAFGSYLRKTSPLFNLLFSPSDLYEPLAISEITVSEGGAKIAKEFSNKYPGSHTVGILVSNPTSVGESYDMDFTVKIQIAENGIIKEDKVISEPYFPFWGAKSNSGIALLHYRVPDDLPLNSNQEVIVTIEKPSQLFEKNMVMSGFM